MRVVPGGEGAGPTPGGGLPNQRPNQGAIRPVSACVRVRLENRCAGNPGTVGSNPTPSAAEAIPCGTAGRYAGSAGRYAGSAGRYAGSASKTSSPEQSMKPIVLVDPT
jgi:hypothetical protein